jgi:hypothetical protein
MKCRPIACVLCFLLPLVLVAPACTKQEASSGNADLSGSAGLSGGPDLSGVYTLVSVDGKDVPTSISHEGASLEVRSGTFTLNADGTCSTKTIFVPPTGSEVAREVSATYTQDGSTLTMKWEGAGETVGTLQGGTFTMNNEGIVFVYRK